MLPVISPKPGVKLKKRETAHSGDPDTISQVCIDVSPAFIKGFAENLPNAAITFDKFHAVKIINDAVDQVRRTEQKEQSLLCGTRYLRLSNPQTLSDRQRTTLGGLPTRHLKTARAYQIRLAFQDLYDQPSVQAGASYLKKWYFWATHSQSNQPSLPGAPSSVTGTASCNGSTARSPTA